MIKLDPDQWQKIYHRLVNEHPPSVMLIRSRMREVLGFTVRNHSEWVEQGKNANGQAYGQTLDWFCLDFYNDAMESWFHLKYMHDAPDNTV
jgi:hypothetical protein